MKKTAQSQPLPPLAIFVVGCLTALAGEPPDTTSMNSNVQTPSVQPNPTQPAAAEALVPVRVRQFHMGMIVRIAVWAPSEAEGRAACRQAFDRVRALDRVFSDYDRQSELSRLCRQESGRAVPVSPELCEVLEQALELAARSGGAYDPTAGPLVEVWRRARREGVLPAASAIAAARERVDYRRIHLDPARRTVTLARDDMTLDLGAIAKGYVGDEVVGMLRERGLPHVAFEAGGDMVFGDPPPGETGWPVALPESTGEAELRLSNCAVSISGDTVQYLEVDGKRYSHVIHAGTGRAVTHRLLCVVTATRGGLSDPLATLGTILEPEGFQTLLADHYPQVRARIVQLDTDETWVAGGGLRKD